MPVQLFPAGLAAVVDGVVAHLAVGNLPVDLPAAVHLAVELALCLNAGGVVGVNQADLAGAAHAAGDHVLPDDVGDVQQVDGLEPGPDRILPVSGCGDHLVDLAHHGHHRAVAAGGAAEGLEPLPLGTDGVIDHHQPVDAPVFPAGQKVKVVLQCLGPALLGIADVQGGGVPGKGQVGVLQPVGGGHQVVGFVQDFQIGAHRGQLVGVRLEHPHPHAAAHHQQVEQVMVGGETVDHRERAVVVGHGVLLGHGGAAHPQRPPGQELAHVVDVVVELLRLLPAGGGQGTVVLHRAAHRLPPELPPAVPGQIAGVGAGVDKGAQLLHGVGGVLVGAEELPAQQPLPGFAAGALLLLFQPVADVGFGGAVVLLFKQGFLHRILDGLDVLDLPAIGFELVHHQAGHPVHRLLVVLPGGRRGQRDGPGDEGGVKGDNLAAALAYVHLLSLLLQCE